MVFSSDLLLIHASLVAQACRRSYRNRPYADNFFELSPFVGYRYGGTIYADQTALFNQDVAVNSAANFGVNFAIPVSNGWKVELMVDRQTTQFSGRGSGLFTPNNSLGHSDIPYFQCGR